MRLRELAWSLWDPIGLLGEGEDWSKKPFADEYDGYLVQAASRLGGGHARESVIAYLIQIESEHMGLGIRKTTEERATALIDTIMSDPKVWVKASE